MEGFNNFDDHYNATMLTLCGFRQIKKLFRLIEIFAVLAFLTWAFQRLPFAVRVSAEYLRRFVKLVAGHLFVFLLANIIVLVLFFKSRADHFMNNELPDISELCRSFVENCGGAAPLPEEVVYHDKETILEVRVHRRSQSANFRRDGAKELRRSETEGRRRVAAELSNEEFQRSIEEFIAKQVKFHQEEKLAIVLHGCN